MLISRPPSLPLFFAGHRPTARRFNFGRSYSMQFPRFWYKPLAAFNRHILALFA
jgi:hypothetical protein